MRSTAQRRPPVVANYSIDGLPDPVCSTGSGTAPRPAPTAFSAPNAAFEVAFDNAANKVFDEVFDEVFNEVFNQACNDALPVRFVHTARLAGKSTGAQRVLRTQRLTT